MPVPAHDPTAPAVAPLVPPHGGASAGPGDWLRTVAIGLVAFLTLVDLFATQAILPSLARAYGVSPAAMGFAVNASTIGMAVAGLAVAFFSRRIDRRIGIAASLAILALPTAALAFAPDLGTFTALRIAQGLCMSAAFTLTLSYLSEHCSARAAAGAFAAYITGNVASNLFGRLLSAALSDTFGLEANFLFFAALNLGGAVLVWFTMRAATMLGTDDAAARSPLAVLREHLADARLRASFGIGFLILFAFIGIFSYVNFVLVRAPLALGMMSLGFVYFVFLPAIATTPLAGRAVQRFGTRPTFWATLAVAGAGLPLLLLPSLAAVVAGLALVGAGTFFAQATATGFVGRSATADHASANGMYLASYFTGGLVGAAVLGQLFDRFGWAACVAGVGVALALAAVLAIRFDSTPAAAPATPGH
jgi:predicted MFS family arabinose efflux permease